MSEQKKKKYVKVGSVWNGKYGEYATLGESKNKNTDYNYDVKIAVKNSKGDVVAQSINGKLALFDPRRPGKDGKVRKVPESLKYELVLTLEE